MVLTSFWSKNRWNKIIQNELNWPNKYDHRTQSSVKLLLQWFFHHSLPGPSPFSLRGNNIDDVDDDDDRDDDTDDDQEDDIDKEDDEYNEDGDYIDDDDDDGHVQIWDDIKDSSGNSGAQPKPWDKDWVRNSSFFFLTVQTALLMILVNDSKNRQ